ncbi:MAG: ribonuclease HII [Ignavibacteriae bacterium]|jgi:ribonuclease HII|nr:ribonuclease HII [Ignavibacteriota bacterium]NOG99681.1 ribonuclease HII [Ignavibacteriota bacterium]
MKNFDNSFLSNKIKLICGVDEAGRGPLAGPVVAASVLFDSDTDIPRINDSKKLSSKLREELFIEITQKALAYRVSIVDERDIDKINILQATLKAMKQSVEELTIKPDLILIDGNKSFYSKTPVKTIVKGDSKSHAIAAASILAKVSRDKLMINAAEKYPLYFWEKNKGYGTKQHIEAIKKIGPCTMHRKTFLSNIIEQKELEIIFGR